MNDFEGVFPYLVSPVNADGSIREQILRELVERLIRLGVNGLVALGSTGEFFYLNSAQKKEIVRIVVDQAAGRVPIIAGVAESSILEGLRMCREIEALGVDGILAALNVYFRLDDEGIFNYFSSIANEVKCPIVVYNNPKFTNYEISLDVLLRLSEIPNIKYYKDATTNISKLFTFQNIVGNRLKIFSASSNVPLFVMLMGGVGWMAGPACVIPKQSIQLYKLCRAGEWEKALLLQKKIDAVDTVFQKYGLAACIKYALTIQGLDVGEPIAPTKKISKEGREEISKVLDSAYRETNC